MLSQPPIDVLVNLVEHKVQQVETGDQRRGQVDITRDGHIDIVFGPNRVGGCKDRGTGVEGGDDACFGDGDGLLFLYAYEVRRW